MNVNIDKREYKSFRETFLSLTKDNVTFPIADEGERFMERLYAGLLLKGVTDTFIRRVETHQTIDRNHMVRDTLRQVPSYNQTLSSLAFSWGETEEGYQFWQKVNDTVIAFHMGKNTYSFTYGSPSKDIPYKEGVDEVCD